MSTRPLGDWADLKYMPGSRTSHVFPFGETKPLCNELLDGSTWHGTGSWEELEHAMGLPFCDACRDGAGLPNPVQPAPLNEFTAPSPLYQEIT